MTMKELWDKLCNDYDVLDLIMDNYKKWVADGKPTNIAEYQSNIQGVVPEWKVFSVSDFTSTCICSDGVLKLTFVMQDDGEAVMSREYCTINA